MNAKTGTCSHCHKDHVLTKGQMPKHFQPGTRKECHGRYFPGTKRDRTGIPNGRASVYRW